MGVNAFVDMGTVTSKYKFERPVVTSPEFTQSDLDALDNASEGIHIGYGGGIRLVINSNFIIACDYGIAAKAQDGDSGLYINLNYLF